MLDPVHFNQGRLEAQARTVSYQNRRSNDAMGTTSHSIEVSAPVQLVYYQWTQFEEFPYFMEAVEEVRRESDTRLFWRTRMGGIERTWEAEITAQIPGHKRRYRL